MTEKNKVVTLVLCILLGYLGIHRFYVGKNKTGILYLLTGGLCGIGWIVDIILICTDKFSGVAVPHNSPVSRPVQSVQPQSVHVPQPVQSVQTVLTAQTVHTQTAQPQTAPITQSTQSQPSKPQAAPTAANAFVPMPSFTPILNDYGLKFEYENDLSTIDTTAEELNPELGGEITFKPEPENAYDSNAVAIWQNGRKLGYIYRGQSQEMANRWIEYGDPVLGFISRIDIAQNKIKYKIGFYRKLENMEKQTYKLTGLRQKDVLDNLREDNLLLCNIGDAVTAEYDDETEKYVVWCNDCEIGNLPKKAEDFLDSKDKAIGILKKSEYTDDDKCVAEVEIYV